MRFDFVQSRSIVEFIAYSRYARHSYARHSHYYRRHHAPLHGFGLRAH
jgi:hypothetical protein